MQMHLWCLAFYISAFILNICEIQFTSLLRKNDESKLFGMKTKAAGKSST